jgi:flagellar hook-associated protein 1 FlgK
MASIYGISTRALLAFQNALSTTGHNIANVNTPGYSRQRVEFSTETPEFAGFGYLGKGVKIGDVRRLYDGFVVDRVRTSQSAYNQQQTYYELASEVDNLLGDSATAISPGLQSFFNAVQEVANDPTSAAARQVLLTEGETLSARFGQLDQALEDGRARVNARMTTVVSEINGYASSIAKLNEDIAAAQSRGDGHAPNDLLDQRDQLIEQLSEQVAVSTVPQDDGAINVFLGSGQTLVLGSDTTTLTAEPLGEDPDRLDIGLQGPGGTVRVTPFITGGTLGGLFEFRDQVLGPAQNALGRIAIGLADTFNTQHRQGLDLDGNTGADFFTLPQAQVIPNAANGGPGPVQVAYDDVNQLSADDYRLSYDGANWALTRLADGQGVPFASGSGTGGDPYIVDGISIVVDSGAVAGDRYLIRPTRPGASGLGVAITENRQIAASDPAAGPGAVGDNGNALALAGLQGALTLASGTASFEQAYSALVGEVGTRTRQAEINANAQGKLLDQAQAERESVSGVNLDEEAANLLRFQQAYQAAAQVIATAEDMFNTLLNAVRR